MTNREKLQARVAYILDMYWLSITAQPYAPADAKARLMCQYETATQFTERLGLQWQRDADGKHKVFGDLEN